MSAPHIVILAAAAAVLLLAGAAWLAMAALASLIDR